MSRQLTLTEKFKVFLISHLGALILSALRASLRVKFELPKNYPNWPGENPIILSFWHNQQLVMPWVYLDKKTKKSPEIHVLISSHADGRIIAELIGLLGIKSVAGSSSQGGKEALQELIKTVKAGGSCAITPDGPRGPIYKCKKGVLKLAVETGAPIFPAAYQVDRFWQFKSWDKMILPKPFAKVTYLVGEPFYAKPDLQGEEFEQELLRLEEKMNQLQGVS